MEKLKILFVSAEVAPFAKTGGLADVAGALPCALAAMGHDVRVLMPLYRQVAHGPWVRKVVVKERTFEPQGMAEDMPCSFGLQQVDLPGTPAVPVYLVDQPVYFDREDLYGDQDGDYRDNGDRFAFFARAALESCAALGFAPDVIHCNDWHTGFLPVYLRTRYKDEPLFKGTGTLFTIHNLAFQGLFPDWQFGRTGLDWGLYNAEGLEFYGQMNTMKGALLFADRVNTVSPRYAQEVRTPEFGCGLEGVLKGRGEDLTGIFNGLDYGTWSPETDQHLSIRYSASTLEKKAEYKAGFLKSLNLDWDASLPLLSVVSRLDSMKGMNLVEELMDYLLHMDLHFILLGTGDARLMDSFRNIAALYPDKAHAHLGYDEDLAHRIFAAADMSLIPSRFEPCGRAQLIGLRYGTVPVARAVGGLADSVKEFDPRSGQGNGFVFSEYNSMGLFNAIQRAMNTFQDKERWRQLQKNGMALDYSWDACARQYVEAYQKVLAARAQA